MKAISWLAIVLAAALGGCSGASLLSGGAEPVTGSVAAAPPQPAPVTPTARAYQVGITSARATKCGFFFDRTKLRATFLAAEQQAGATPEDLAKIEKNYDVSDATMTKVIAQEENYCSAEKTKYIKADLTRHLAGDYNPGPPHPKKAEEEGLLSFGEVGEGPPVFVPN